jgi:hypothetical protein
MYDSLKEAFHLVSTNYPSRVGFETFYWIYKKILKKEFQMTSQGKCF